MTILVGFSASRQSDAPVNLGSQIAQNAGEPIVAAAVIEKAWPPRVGDPVEKEYLHHLTAEVERSLRRVVDRLPGGADIPTVVHQSASIPTGLMELAEERSATLVVVGSSSSGLIGRVTLGSVTDRLVHTAAIPVAIAPRGYPLPPGRVRRITAAYGGEADIHGLLGAASELAKAWSVPLRIVSFSVRPVPTFGGTVDSSAEALVIEKWAQRTQDEIEGHLDEIRSQIAAPDVEVTVVSGHDWREAVESAPWEPGDIMALGSGVAGETARVFLGSVGSRIVRNSPVPVMIVPRHRFG